MIVQLNTGDYDPYAQAAYNRGYAFVEYDIVVDGSVVTVPDAVEVTCKLTFKEEMNSSSASLLIVDAVSMTCDDFKQPIS